MLSRIASGDYKHAELGRDDFHCLHLATYFKDSTLISFDLMRDRSSFPRMVSPYRNYMIHTNGYICSEYIYPQDYVMSKKYHKLKTYCAFMDFPLTVK